MLYFNNDFNPLNNSPVAPGIFQETFFEILFCVRYFVQKKKIVNIAEIYVLKNVMQSILSCERLSVHNPFCRSIFPSP